MPTYKFHVEDFIVTGYELIAKYQFQNYADFNKLDSKGTGYFVCGLSEDVNPDDYIATAYVMPEFLPKQHALQSYNFDY